MSGSHRANPNTIHVIRTLIVKKRDDIRRAKTRQWRVIMLKKFKKKKLFI